MRDGREALLRIKGQRAIQRRVDRQHADIALEDGVPVWGGARHHLGPDVAAAAAAIFHHDLLAEQRPQPRRDEARRDVGGAASGEGQHDANGPRRPVLRAGDGREGQSSGEGGAAGKHRGAPEGIRKG